MPDLYEKYKASDDCSCSICTSFCKRPGWWTPAEAEKAMESGLSDRMMLEISPEFSFSVLSPAFKGAEVNYALSKYSGNSCTFLKDGLCELHATPNMPLECRFCHHDRMGEGKKCHAEIESEWNSKEAQKIVQKWINTSGFGKKLEFYKKYGLPR